VDQQASVYERQTHDEHLNTAHSDPLCDYYRAAAATRQPVSRLGRQAVVRWSLLDDVRQIAKVPMLVKGIATEEDARLCLEHGWMASLYPNHGGRSLDLRPFHARSAAGDRRCVRGRIPILFDSGIRRGSDILKALALGARRVSLGRVPLWGLGAYGAQGVQKGSRNPARRTGSGHGATGRPTLASIDRTLVRTEFL